MWIPLSIPTNTNGELEKRTERKEQKNYKQIMSEMTKYIKLKKWD